MGKIHAQAMGTQSAIEALSAHKGQFILIDEHMHAVCKNMARHPHFQADTFATLAEAEAEKRLLDTLSSRFVEHAPREITDAFINEFRDVCNSAIRPQPKGPTYR